MSAQGTVTILGGGVEGELQEALDAAGDHAAGDHAAGDHVSDDLAEYLYGAWYARPRWSIARPGGFPASMLEMLRASHVGSARWEDGWKVVQAGPRGQIVARRGKQSRLVERTDYAVGGASGLVGKAGDSVSVTGRVDMADHGDGWWRTCGRSWSWTAHPTGLVRLYWSIQLAGLPGLIERLTDRLAEEKDPWLIKCAPDPQVHARDDGTVVYLTTGALERCSDAMVEIAVGLGGHARPGRPPLTLGVTTGLSAAFDPGQDESFGMHRCRLIAEAIAIGGGTGDPISAIRKQFEGEGLDLARPWARRTDPFLAWEQ